MLHADHLLRRLRWEEISPEYLQKLVETARDEDLGGLGLATPPAVAGDPTTALLAPTTASARARLVARTPCVACGLNLVPHILHAYLTAGSGARAGGEFYVEDGDEVATGTVLATLEGPAETLLRAERVLLNFLQKLSGIATLAATFAARLRGTGTRVLDTRKTTPGWRVLEKYAAATGGAWNHRLGLHDRIMLKDNHLAAGKASAGERLAAIVRQARLARPDLAVECEVDEIAQIQPVLEAGADVILLDNFPLPALKPALDLIGTRAWTEVSGGVSLESIAEIARLGPDFISAGAIIHRAAWTDIGIDWDA